MDDGLGVRCERPGTSGPLALASGPAPRTQNLAELPTLPCRPTSTDPSVADPLRDFSRRYELLEWLGRGGMGEVFRARDRLHGRMVALKRVTARRSGTRRLDDTDSAMALAAEFRLLASLRHPHIISVFDYGFDAQGSPFFTMELLVGAQSLTEAGNGTGAEGKLALFLQMLQALAYLHRRGVLHRDLKPSNVQVAGHRVKLLDFGIAIPRERAAEASDKVSGTISYMAPEMVTGATHSERTDLYAAGLIGYHLFAGVHPFESSGLAQFLERLTAGSVDLERIEVPAAREVLGRLLARDPAERYGDAGEAASALARACGTASPETAEIRRSVLESIPVVGRDRELAELAGCLDAALDGRGHSVLVTGECGVGKSRLIERTRKRALVKGVAVLGGEARREGSGPFQLWQDVFRWLCLLADPDDAEAGVLSAHLADAGRLLRRRAPTPERLDPDAARRRLETVVVQLLERLRQPVLLTFEDLQWAGDESLALLREVSARLRDRPVLVLAAATDDGTGVIASRLPGFSRLELEVFERPAIAELAGAVFGDAGRQTRLVRFLEQQTGGNAFLLVEAMDALAASAGGIDDVTADWRPLEVAGLGRRRLAGLEPASRALLEAAALAGRTLHLGLLRTFEPGVDLMRWLGESSAAGFLEHRDGVWRFRHERLRQTLIDTVEPERRRRLHHRIAVILTDLFAASPEITAALAHHWSEAGDARQARYYAERAGMVALEAGAYREAVVALELAARLARQLRAPADHRARIHQHLARARLELGEVADGRRHLEEAAALWGWGVPQWRPLLVPSLALEKVRGGCRSLWPRSRRRPLPHRVSHEVSKLYEGLSRIYRDARLEWQHRVVEARLSRLRDPMDETARRGDQLFNENLTVRL